MHGWSRAEVDALTWSEVVGVLTEQTWQEQDRRHWSYALEVSLKAGENPFEAYEEIRRSVEDQMAPPEPIPDNMRAWYEAR